MPAFCSLLLLSYYSNNFAGKIDASLMERLQIIYKPNVCVLQLLCSIVCVSWCVTASGSDIVGFYSKKIILAKGLFR